MSVPKITSPQFEDQIRTGILALDNTVDTGFGPVYDIVINPQAQVFEQQNDRLREVSQLISLENLSQFSDADLDGLVFNEGLIRNNGDQATGTVVFSRSAQPVTNINVQRGFQIATSPDESTGRTVTYVTAEARTLVSANAASYFNITTQRYELTVPVIALVQGPAGRVGPNRITRPLRPLVGFDTVTNPAAVTTGGVSTETNDALAERYQISVQGRQLSTPTGIKKYVLDGYPDVKDINVVYGNNPLLTRAATDAGAVDAFVEATTTILIPAEQHTYLGVGQVVAVNLPPMQSIVSVLVGATTLTERTDYDVVFDTTGVSGSTRAQDGIIILPGHPTSLTAGSSVLSITYTYYDVVRDLQAASLDEDVLVLGRDLLYRSGTDVVIVLNANLTASSGFNPTTIAGFVSTAVSSYVNSVGLGGLVEAFEIEVAAGSVSGVANFVITRLSRSTDASGISDIQLTGAEFPTIDASTLVLTPV